MCTLIIPHQLILLIDMAPYVRYVFFGLQLLAIIRKTILVYMLRAIIHEYTSSLKNRKSHPPRYVPCGMSQLL